MNDNQSIKNATRRYYSELFQIRTQIENEAKQKLNAVNDEILGGLVEALRGNIPQGKWKKFFEETFSFGMPSKQVLEHDKICLWRMLDEHLNIFSGIPFIDFKQYIILNSGFDSWDNFISELPDFNEYIGNVFVIDVPTEKISKKQKEYRFVFRITCLPEENRKRQVKKLDELIELGSRL